MLPRHKAFKCHSKCRLEVERELKIFFKCLNKIVPYCTEHTIVKMYVQYNKIIKTLSP